MPVTILVVMMQVPEVVCMIHIQTKLEDLRLPQQFIMIVYWGSDLYYLINEKWFNMSSGLMGAVCKGF